MPYKVPKDIWSHLDSAQSLLDDAAALPGAFKHNATRYFLWVKAWELYHIANAKFHAWAQETPVDPKVMKDHVYKLNGSPEVQYIAIIDGKAVETMHNTGQEKSKLLQTLLFGTDEKSRQDVFMRGWHFDTFHRELVGKIQLLHVVLKGLEEIE